MPSRDHRRLRRERNIGAAAVNRKQELTLTFDELALIYRSLEAVKALGALPSEDELLDDTIQLVDQALNDAIAQVARD